MPGEARGWATGGRSAVGVLVLLTASAVQALGVNAFSPLDHDGLYHAISMVGVVFMYWGGQRLKVI